MNNCNCNEPACHEPCKIYPFVGVNYTAEEVNRLLGEIDKKASANNFRDGLSAYEVAVKNGYKGTEEEWLASLRGPRGEALQFEDLTQDELDLLKEPATKAGEEVKEQTDNAIKNVNEVTAKAIQETESAAEEARKQAEIAGQSALETQKQGDIAEQKGNEADNKASEAESAAIRANEAADRVTNDGLFKTPQDLSEEEQAQVKRNIGIQDFIAGLTTLPIADFSDKVNATTATKTVDNIIPKEISFLIVDIGVLEGDSSLPASPELSAVLCPVSGGGRVVFQGTASTKFENFKISVISGSAENDGMGVEVSTPRSITYKVFQVRYLTETDSASFKGSFNSSGILQSTYPTAKPGDYAYVGNPRHLYEWDSSAWQDRGLYITDVDQALDSASGKAIANKVVTAKLTVLADTQTTQGEEIEKINAEAVFSDANTEEFPQPEQTSSDYATSALQDWKGNNIHDYYATKAQLADIKPVVINGNVTNNADNEDLESDVDPETGKAVMHFKDRPYIPGTFGGKGYKILRMNIVTENRLNSNILTQDMFSDSNTVYVIRYDFDLLGETINIPEGCTLRFDGGSFKNGIVKGNNTLIEANEYNYIFNNVQLKGQYTNSYASVCWFGAINSLKDGILNQTGCTDAINLVLSCDFNAIKFPRGYWFIDNTIVLNRRIDILLDGEMSVVPLNNRADKHISSDAVLYTNKNISIIEVNYTENKIQRFELIGGVLDVSLAEEYTSPVVHISTKTSKLWGINIATAILDRTLRGTGIGIYIDGDYEEKCSGYATYITLQSTIYNFSIGCKVSLRAGNNAWITDLTDKCDIVTCKQAIYVHNIDTVKLLGRYQSTYYYSTKENNEAVVYIHGRFIDIDAKIWDMALPNPNGGETWSNQYAVELDKDCQNINFIGSSNEYISKGLVKNYTTITAIYSRYADYNRSPYCIGGYNELDNWFIKRPQFTASYDSNCTVQNFDNLFLPNASQQVDVNVSGVDNPFIKITIEISESTSVSILLMGLLLDVDENKTFTKANMKLYDKESEEPLEDITVGINTYIASKIIPVYFLGFENKWRKTSKVEITLSDYIGTGNPSLYSVFGKIKQKGISFLTYGGGDLNGPLDVTATGVIKKENKPLITNKIVQSPEDLTNDYADTAMFDYRGFIGTIALKTRNYWGFVYPRNIKYRKIGKSLGRPVITANNTISEYLDYYNTETRMMEYATGEDNDWRNAMGDPVSAKYSGTFAQKPSNVRIGFSFFCTDKQTTEGTTNGIMIYHKGENVWVDALGRVVS